MKKVLIVSPNWPPISCPDMHRVRMALPFLNEFGWEPLILKIDPDEQEGIKDPELNRTIPDDIKVWQAGCISKEWTRWFGLNNVGLRSFFHLARLGSKIIKNERPNLVFFSTTMFPVMSLGRYWLFKHGMPYVLDFQDPWLSDYQGQSGSRYKTWKYKVSQFIARALEPFSLRHVSHVVSVSPEYPKTFLQRYPWLRQDQFTIMPFGAAENDFSLLPDLKVQQKLFDPNDGKVHWVYVGRGGKDMAFALRAFFKALRKARTEEQSKYGNVMLHFVGTDYAPGDKAQKTVEPVAVECGVGDMVWEYPNRIPYFEALQCLLDADALIVPGSDDLGYTASKIYPYILARKPLLAVFHAKSSVVDVLRSTNAGTVVTFINGDDCDLIAQKIAREWLHLSLPPKPITNWEAFRSYTAREMTRRLCESFNQCLPSIHSE